MLPFAAAELGLVFVQKQYTVRYRNSWARPCQDLWTPRYGMLIVRHGETLLSPEAQPSSDTGRCHSLTGRLSSGVIRNFDFEGGVLPKRGVCGISACS